MRKRQNKQKLPLSLIPPVKLLWVEDFEFTTSHSIAACNTILHEASKSIWSGFYLNVDLFRETNQWFSFRAVDIRKRVWIIGQVKKTDAKAVVVTGKIGCGMNFIYTPLLTITPIVIFLIVIAFANQLLLPIVIACLMIFWIILTIIFYPNAKANLLYALKRKLN